MGGWVVHWVGGFWFCFSTHAYGTLPLFDHGENLRIIKTLSPKPILGLLSHEGVALSSMYSFIMFYPRTPILKIQGPVRVGRRIPPSFCRLSPKSTASRGQDPDLAFARVLLGQNSCISRASRRK